MIGFTYESQNSGSAHLKVGQITEHNGREIVGRRHEVTIFVDKDAWGRGTDPTAEVNWSAHGSVPAEDALEYGETIVAAAQLAAQIRSLMEAGVGLKKIAKQLAKFGTPYARPVNVHVFRGDNRSFLYDQGVIVRDN